MRGVGDALPRLEKFIVAAVCFCEYNAVQLSLHSTGIGLRIEVRGVVAAGIESCSDVAVIVGGSVGDGV